MSIMKQIQERRALLESVEQIDELSKDTLKSYMHKALKSSDAHEKAADNYAKMGANKASSAHAKKALNRHLGHGLAGAKRNSENMHMGATKPGGKRDTRMYIDHEGNGHSAKVRATEEVEQIDEGMRKIATYHSEDGKHHATVHKDTEWGEYRVKYHTNGVHHKDADSHHGDADDAHGTARHNLAHMEKTHTEENDYDFTDEQLEAIVEEMTVEEYEQLDELSKNTLGSYIRRANADQGQAHRDHVMDMVGGANQKTLNSHLKRAEKRNTGIRKAVARLTK